MFFNESLYLREFIADNKKDLHINDLLLPDNTCIDHMSLRRIEKNDHDIISKRTGISKKKWATLSLIKDKSQVDKGN